MSRNVLIPLPLLSKAIDLLEHWDLDGYDPAVLCDYDEVYLALLNKRRNLELREAYSKILFAEDEDARFQAKMRYLQQKRDHAGCL